MLRRRGSLSRTTYVPLGERRRPSTPYSLFSTGAQHHGTVSQILFLSASEHRHAKCQTRPPDRKLSLVTIDVLCTGFEMQAISASYPLSHPASPQIMPTARSRGRRRPSTPDPEDEVDRLEIGNLIFMGSLMLMTTTLAHHNRRRLQLELATAPIYSLLDNAKSRTSNLNNYHLDISGLCLASYVANTVCIAMELARMHGTMQQLLLILVAYCVMGGYAELPYDRRVVGCIHLLNAVGVIAAAILVVKINKIHHSTDANDLRRS
ncbi:hypothetical protein BC834DRAFT_900713, partial [Gloeopeniophorella convolvens]